MISFFILILIFFIIKITIINTYKKNYDEKNNFEIQYIYPKFDLLNYQYKNQHLDDKFNDLFNNDNINVYLNKNN